MEFEIITLGVTLVGMIGLNVYLHNFFKRITERLDEINGDLMEIHDSINDIGPKMINNAKNINRLLQS
jgi:hypothetical protein